VQLNASAVDSGMRNRWADEFERSLRSEACHDGLHNECPHFDGFAAGLNPRRMRFEAGAGLCKCDCHSSCPITSTRITVSPRTWRQSCTCPGAEAERIRHDQAGVEFPDWDELQARYRQESQSQREAFQAARASAEGKSREEIKDLYLAELRSRGLGIPPQEILDADVDALTGNYLTGARLLGRSIVNLGKVLWAFRPPC
jgi:hypothetical protein